MNVRGTESGDSVDLRPGHSWRFEVEHGLQDGVQLRYCGRHDGPADFPTTVDVKWTGKRTVPF